MVEFGERIRRAREAKGMTQQSLAEELFVARQTVSRWECGDRFPDLVMAKKISETLEISIDELMENTKLTTVVEKSNIASDTVSKRTVLLFYSAICLGLLFLACDIFIRFVGRFIGLTLMLKFSSYDISLAPLTNYTSMVTLANNSKGLLVVEPLIYWGRAIVSVIAFRASIKGNLLPRSIGSFNIFYLSMPIIGAIYSLRETTIAGNEMGPIVVGFSLNILIQLALIVGMYLFFNKNKFNKVLSCVIVCLCAYRIINDIYHTWYYVKMGFIHHNFPYLMYVFAIVDILIYVSLIVQTIIVKKKRMIASNERLSIS